MKTILIAGLMAAVCLPGFAQQASPNAAPQRIWADTGHGPYREYGSGLSQDGRLAGFVLRNSNNDEIWIHDLSAGKSRRVGGLTARPQTFRHALISPDGRQIAYIKETGGEGDELHVAGVDSGVDRRLVKWDKEILRCKLNGWSPDSRQILVSARMSRELEQTLVISAANGASRVLGSHMRGPRFSPDGASIVFAQPVNQADTSPGSPAKVFLMPASGGAPRTLTDRPDDWDNLMWSPDGARVLLFPNRPDGWGADMLAIRVENGSPQGPPQPIAEKLQMSTLLGSSSKGDLYFHRYREDAATLQLTEVDPQTGKMLSPPKPLSCARSSTGAAWSPDGSRLAFWVGRGDSVGFFDVDIRNMSSGEEKILEPAKPLGPEEWGKLMWFPDGRSLLIHPFEGPFRQLDTETGKERLLWENLQPAEYFSSSALAPDGSAAYLVLDANRIMTPGRPIARRLLPSGKENRVCRIVADELGAPGVSPDGKTIAFVALFEGGRWALMTVVAGGGEPRELLRRKSGPAPKSTDSVVWSRDGKRIYYATPAPEGGGHAEIWSVAAVGGEPVPLGIGLDSILFGDLAPDGRRLIFADLHQEQKVWVTKGLLAPAGRGR